MVNRGQLLTKLKATPKMSLRARKQIEAQGTPTTPRNEEDEQKLLETIRKIVKDEFASHELVIKEMINASIKDTKERLDKISQDVSDLKQSLEYTQDETKEEIGNINTKLKDLEKNVKDIEEDLLDPEEVSSKLIELEDRSRRNNLRIDGIKEKPNETWEECEENVQEMIKEKLGITEPIEIDRCHRISKRKKPNRPRTVICRITKFKDKQKILKNAKYLKGSGIYVYEDFCKETMELRKTLWDQVLEYRRQNKFAYLNYRSIVVRDQENDRVVR